MRSIKLIVTGVVLISHALISTTLHAQTYDQRQRLKQLAEELSVEYQVKRAEAEAFARQMGIPIRVSDKGVTMELQRIEDGIPMYYVTQNLNAARTISTNKVWPGGGAGFDLTGSMETLGVWDEGRVRSEHQEFGINRVTQQDGASINSDHATHVAGTMVATGVQANAKGMAYQASLHAYYWDDDLGEMADAAANGLRVSNHSYGLRTGWDVTTTQWNWFGSTTISPTKSYLFGFYGSQARTTDNIAYNAPNYLIVKSSGNNRLQGPPQQPLTHTHNGFGSFTDTHDPDCAPQGYDCLEGMALAKNVITVGSVNDITGGYSQPSGVVIAAYSSWGPTDDGRIKPDIVANGQSVYSPVAYNPAGNLSSISYANESGTSMAAPNASGSIGLLLQHHRNLYGDNALRSATLKGIVIHTADEAGSNPGPDYQFGWGLMNTRKATQLMQDNFERGGSHFYELILNQSETIEFQISSNGDSPLTGNHRLDRSSGT